jgi:superfamily II DNA/RNA helicase
VGRTARAGRTGEGVTFVTPDQRVDVGRIARTLELDAEFVHAGFPPADRRERPTGRAHLPRGGRRRRPSGGR